MEINMIKKIEQVLDEYVRPKLAAHYGNVKVINFNDGILEIKLEGQCSNCPSARSTIDDIIEGELKEHVSEIKKVVLIEGVSDDLIDFAKKLLNKEIPLD
jgi:Fe-S cluster biogenesis protein NfuA